VRGLGRFVGSGRLIDAFIPIECASYSSLQASDGD
jgi:hypothetical protein